MRPGIYSVTCTVTDTVYVGSAKDPTSRWREHQRGLNAGQHGNRHLQAAWSKYGDKAFRFGVLEEIEPELFDALRAVREQWWIQVADALGGIYNISPAGMPPDTTGIPKSPEHAAKVGAAFRGKTLSPQHRAKLSGGGNGTKTRPDRVPRGDGHWTHTHPEKVARGARHGRAKLTEAKVLEIRRRYTAGGVTYKELSQQFGVSVLAVGHAVRGKTWTYVENG